MLPATGCKDFDALDRAYCPAISVDAGSPSCVRDVGAGWAHTCALKTDDSVWCWGYDQAGQLGPNAAVVEAKQDAGSLLLAPVWSGVTGSGANVRLGVGDSTNCVLADGGSLVCWGLGDQGQLNDGHDSHDAPRTVSLADGGAVATAVTVGSISVCAITSDQRVSCWGDNTYGQLGRPDGGTELQADFVPELQATEVALGSTHACALFARDNTVVCWGDNTYGQLGDGTTTSRSKFAITGLVAVHAAAGFHHSCAVKNDGTLWCWGLNDRGQLGDGTLTDRKVPTRVSSLTDVAAVSANGRSVLGQNTGFDSHTCALKTNGSVWCWGANPYGQIGDGTTTDRLVPTPVLCNAIAVTAGQDHTCALRGDGSIWCWGLNTYGQLGTGTTTESLVPVRTTSFCP
jgi:alpha-tubulin suppressor-like RCC1 family protein